ncbi:hypothetical protein J6590_038542 [Homalodisca vitripennis]|nr:hypothetical protein J6590_038542 [Homalodisca vitripennis]
MFRELYVALHSGARGLPNYKLFSASSFLLTHRVSPAVGSSSVRGILLWPLVDVLAGHLGVWTVHISRVEGQKRANFISTITALGCVPKQSHSCVKLFTPQRVEWEGAVARRGGVAAAALPYHRPQIIPSLSMADPTTTGPYLFTWYTQLSRPLSILAKRNVLAKVRLDCETEIDRHSVPDKEGRLKSWDYKTIPSKSRYARWKLCNSVSPPAVYSSYSAARGSTPSCWALLPLNWHSGLPSARHGAALQLDLDRTIQVAALSHDTCIIDLGKALRFLFGRGSGFIGWARVSRDYDERDYPLTAHCYQPPPGNLSRWINPDKPAGPDCTLLMKYY